jgi:RND family efflux transporter MFP subunit
LRIEAISTNFLVFVMRQAARAAVTLLSYAALCAVFGCSEAEPEEKPQSRQSVSAGSGVHLSREARTSVGISTAPVQSQLVRSTINTTGWLAVRPGHEVTIKAAATGFVIPEIGKNPIQVGAGVTAGQRLGTLQVFVSPQEEAQLVALKEEADILVRQSKATLEAAEARLHRAERLSENGTIPGKEIQLAKAAVEQARAAYEETQEQLPFLPAEPYERPLRLDAVAIDAPQGGRVLQAHVRPRQLVVHGDPLWTIADWSSLWLRVPVFEGDLPSIDQKKSAEVTVPGSESCALAKPTGIPQPTQEGRRTVDLIYEVANADAILRPGQAVAVSLPTGETGKRLVVPRSAVIWDGMGNATVYVQGEGDVFRRRRIRVGRSTGDLVVVEQGLTEGQPVVTVGAEALYGEQFKGQIQILDDDD